MHAAHAQATLHAMLQSGELAHAHQAVGQALAQAHAGSPRHAARLLGQHAPAFASLARVSQAQFFRSREQPRNGRPNLCGASRARLRQVAGVGKTTARRIRRRIRRLVRRNRQPSWADIERIKRIRTDAVRNLKRIFWLPPPGQDDRQQRREERHAQFWNGTAVVGWNARRTAAAAFAAAQAANNQDAHNAPAVYEVGTVDAHNRFKPVYVGSTTRNPFVRMAEHAATARRIRAAPASRVAASGSALAHWIARTGTQRVCWRWRQVAGPPQRTEHRLAQLLGLSQYHCNTIMPPAAA